jgi:hypothetical protein
MINIRLQPCMGPGLLQKLPHSSLFNAASFQFLSPKIPMSRSTPSLSLSFGTRIPRSMMQFSNSLLVFLSVLNKSVRLLLFKLSYQLVCYGVRLLTSSPTPNLEDQAYVFMSPGDTGFPSRAPFTTPGDAVRLFLSAPSHST